MQIIDDANEDLTLFKNDKSAYTKKVNDLSEDMGFHGEKFQLKSNYLPTYYAGNIYGNNMIVIVGANPGWNNEGNKIEEELKKKDYFGFCNDFFQCFYKAGLRSRYYEYSNRIWGIVAGLTEHVTNNLEEKYNILHQNVINIDLIPYHSTGFHNPAKKTKEAIDYLENRKKKLKKYISELDKPRLLIFNSATINNLLDLPKDEKQCLEFKRENNRQNKMYLFYFNEVPAICFDAQIGSSANPTRKEDIIKVVDYIKDKFFK